MFWLLVVTQVLILAVVVAVPLFLWKTRDYAVRTTASYLGRWVDLVRTMEVAVTQWASVAGSLEVAQMASSNYVAGQVTLANAGQEYNLLVLIQAQIDKNCPGGARELCLQATHGNSALIYVGSGNVSSTVYGYSLVADATRVYSSAYQNIILGSICVLSTSPGQKLGVEVMAS